MSNEFWFVGSVLFALLDAYDGYENRNFVSLLFALLWSFAAGLHFAGMVMPA